MPLANFIQYARKRAQTITWTDDDGNALDLTGATLYGRMENSRTLERKSVTGTLVLSNAPAGVFIWTPSAADVADAGNFMVQFKAIYQSDGKSERSYKTALKVFESFDSPSASPSASASASPSVSPSLSPSASKSPSASASP